MKTFVIFFLFTLLAILMVIKFICHVINQFQIGLVRFVEQQRWRGSKLNNIQN